MASPDFQPYIDLTINDQQPAEIYTDAVEYARLALPEFSARPGTIEDAILQAVAYVGSTNLAAINRLPDGLMEGIMQLMGVSRLESTFATVEVEFQLSDDGLTMAPEFGVVYQTTDGDQVIQYPFYTTELLEAAVDGDTIAAEVICSVAGVIPSLPIGTELTIAQPDASVLTCVTTSLVTQGDSAETDEEFFSRATSILQLLNSTLVTAAQVEAYILSTYTDVHRCKVYDLRKVLQYSAPAATNNASSSAYTVTVLANSAFYNAADFTTGLFRVVTGDFDGSDIGDATAFPTGHFVPTGSSPASFTYTNEYSGSGTTGPVNVVDMASLVLDSPTETPGYFAVFVCDADGDPLSAAKKLEIYNDVNSKITAGLQFSILDAFLVDLNVVVTISVSDEFGAGDVSASLIEALESYFSPANWPNWNTTVRVFDVVIKSSAVSGVAYVHSVTAELKTFDSGARPGNELLAEELLVGGVTSAFEVLYAGILPRISVEVVVQ
jgi:hypothetical protein